jgi:hypothetical protein
MVTPLESSSPEEAGDCVFDSTATISKKRKRTDSANVSSGTGFSPKFGASAQSPSSSPGKSQSRSSPSWQSPLIPFSSAPASGASYPPLSFVSGSSLHPSSALRGDGNDLPTSAPPATVEKTLALEQRVLSGSASPRTVVATQFQGLALHVKGGGQDHDEEMRRFGSNEEPGEKRQCIEDLSLDIPSEEAGQHPKSDNVSTTTPPRGITSPRPRRKSLPASSSSSSSNRSTSSKPAGRLQSLPSSPPSSSESKSKSSAGSAAAAAMGKDLDAAVDLAALTWQDSEITGHLVTDPDDDGYGINGIGFKPTPAMQQSRTQRRRAQVSAWRSREAREERERRARLRRLQGAFERKGGDMGFDAGKKVVRFAV